LKNTAIITT